MTVFDVFSGLVCFKTNCEETFQKCSKSTEIHLLPDDLTLFPITQTANDI